MANISEYLSRQFSKSGAAPFMFVGSGFSRRYLGLEDWSSLLRRFCGELKQYEYYFASANGDLPTVAQLVADDFHELWWSSHSYEASREKHRDRVKDKTSALRIEICNYINSIAATNFTDAAFPEEVAALSRLNVDGIITTNWDGFLERLYPDYRVYVGQNELLFSNPQSIGEIYKIHGSSSRPSSLVLTKSDYDDFSAKNAYLAAKLITLFVEHPIVFIGYSLTDPNITSLLSAIVKCLGDENLKKMAGNLFFIQRAHGTEPSISETVMAIDTVQLPINIIKTDDFLPVYEALYRTKRKIPTRVLRYCKEQLYKLVQSSAPETKLSVVDIDSIEQTKDIEFVVGVGVSVERESMVEREKTAEIGYQGVGAFDLFTDVILDSGNFDPRKILESTIPTLRGLKYVPVYKYLKGVGIKSGEQYGESGFSLNKYISTSPRRYETSNYTKPYIRTEKEKTAKEIVETNPPEKAAIFLTFLPKESFDLEVVRQFLTGHINLLKDPACGTYFKKLTCLYDYFAFGWNK